jgi:hypothetical protein
MKGLWFDLWSLEIVSQAVGCPADIYATTSAGLSTLAQFQKLVDEYAEEGQLKRKLALSMIVELAEFGGRWDSKLLRFQCASIDDIVAGLLQPVLGEYFFASAGSDAERLRWRDEIFDTMKNVGFVSFDVLLRKCRDLIRRSDGVQIWMANDCDVGESSGRSMVATGSREKLNEMFRALGQISGVSDTYGLREDPSLPRWIELPAVGT